MSESSVSGGGKRGVVDVRGKTGGKTVIIEAMRRKVRWSERGEEVCEVRIMTSDNNNNECESDR